MHLHRPPQTVLLELCTAAPARFWTRVGSETLENSPREVSVSIKVLGDFLTRFWMWVPLTEPNRSLPGGSGVKNPPARVGDMGWIPDPKTSYMPWSCKAWAPWRLSLYSKAPEPQLLKPTFYNYWSPGALEPELHKEASAMRSLPIATRELPPLTATREKPAHQRIPSIARNQHNFFKNRKHSRNNGASSYCSLEISTSPDISWMRRTKALHVPTTPGAKTPKRNTPSRVTVWARNANNVIIDAEGISDKPPTWNHVKQGRFLLINSDHDSRQTLRRHILGNRKYAR